MDFVRGGELFYYIHKADYLDEYTIKFISTEILIAIEDLHT